MKRNLWYLTDIKDPLDAWIGYVGWDEPRLDILTRCWAYLESENVACSDDAEEDDNDDGNGDGGDDDDDDWDVEVDMAA